MPVRLRPATEVVSIVSARVLHAALSAASAAKQSTGSLADGIWKSFSMLMVGGLGDKSFLVTALMAMKCSKLIVFVSASVALLVVHSCSVGIAFVFDYIPTIVTKVISILLFLFFGAKMMWDSFHMKPSSTSSLEDAQAETDRKVLASCVITPAAPTVSISDPSVPISAPTAPTSSMAMKSLPGYSGMSVQFYSQAVLHSVSQIQRSQLVSVKEAMSSFGRWRRPATPIEKPLLPSTEGDGDVESVSTPQMMETGAIPPKVKISVLPVPGSSSDASEATPSVAETNAPPAPFLSEFADLRQQTQPENAVLNPQELREGDLEPVGLKERLLSRCQCCVNNVFVSVFFVIFLSEWGDRSQIATVALASQTDKFGVWLGGSIANTILTGLAVVCGTVLSRFVSERVLMFVGSLLFFAFGIQTIVEAVQLYV